jgi:hypothetical protein
MVLGSPGSSDFVQKPQQEGTECYNGCYIIGAQVLCFGESESAKHRQISAKNHLGETNIGKPLANRPKFALQVTVRCPCRRQKKEWPCTDVRAAQSKSCHQGLELLTCDKDCKRLAEHRRALEAATAQNVGDKPQEKELPRKPEEGPWKGRRRGGRRRDEEKLESQQVRAHLCK